ncbi:MAG: response regulator [Myxococcota bacterium]
MPDALEALRAVFRDELDDQLAALDEAMARLDGPEAPDALATVHRIVHTLKGAARTVGHEAFASTCHALETATVAGTPPAQVSDRLRDFRETAQAFAASLRPAPSTEPPEPVASETVRVQTERIADLVGQAEALVGLASRDAVGALAELRGSVTRLGTTLRRIGADARRGAVSVAQVDTALAASRALDQSLVAAQNQATHRARRLLRGAVDVFELVRQLQIVRMDLLAPTLERAAADAAQLRAREVDLQLDLSGVEATRTVCEALREPLAHLVRNAVDHGIEAPAERVAAGKPARGQVRVAATWAAGDRVEVDATAAAASTSRRPAAPRGVAEGWCWWPGEEAQVLFESGFDPGTMTAVGARAPNRRSWRRPWRGSTAGSRSSPGGSRHGCDAQCRRTWGRAGAGRGAARRVAGDGAGGRGGGCEPRAGVGGVARRRRGRDPAPGLAPVVGLGPAVGGPPRRSARRCWSCGCGQEERLALPVDAVARGAGARRARAGRRLAGCSLVAAAGIVGERAIPLLDVAAIASARELRVGPGGAERIEVPHLLVVDDSFTTRTMLRTVLESASYRVERGQQGGGAGEALAALGVARSAPGRISLVMTDLEMPEMDGLQLVTRIRGTASLRSLPVVLVTGRSAAADRRRAMEARRERLRGEGIVRGEDRLSGSSGAAAVRAVVFNVAHGAGRACRDPRTGAGHRGRQRLRRRRARRRGGGAEPHRTSCSVDVVMPGRTAARHARDHGVLPVPIVLVSGVVDVGGVGGAGALACGACASSTSRRRRRRRLRGRAQVRPAADHGLRQRPAGARRGAEPPAAALPTG